VKRSFVFAVFTFLMLVSLLALVLSSCGTSPIEKAEAVAVVADVTRQAELTALTTTLQIAQATQEAKKAEDQRAQDWAEIYQRQTEAQAKVKRESTLTALSVTMGTQLTGAQAKVLVAQADEISADAAIKWAKAHFLTTVNFVLDNIVIFLFAGLLFVIIAAFINKLGKRPKKDVG